MENKKMTKRDYYNTIMELCADNSEIVAFCEHEIELLNKKNARTSRGETKAQKANHELRERLFDTLTDEPMTIKELQDMGFDYSNQKLSALLNQLVTDFRIEKTEKVVDKSRKVAFKKVGE